MICTHRYHDNLIFACRWSQQRVSSRILLFWLMHFGARSCGLRVLRYITKVSKYEERFFSILSRFSNMKGFYWAVRIDLSLSCDQLKNNCDLSCPKLSGSSYRPAVPGYNLAVPKAVMAKLSSARSQCRRSCAWSRLGGSDVPFENWLSTVPFCIARTDFFVRILSRNG